MTPEYLDWVIDTYQIDYVVHGDDPCIGPDGKDVYGHVKVFTVWSGLCAQVKTLIS
jgi:ethanolamine-phosphate cytidylyltransferase